MRKLVSALMISSFLVASCAANPDKISPAYVSPIQYQSYNCNQIRQEMMRVSRHVNEITGKQQSQADGDAVALGVGLVLFWPALFFMIGKDKEEELARLKGEYDALEQTAIQKECDVAAEIEAAKKMKEEREAKREQQRSEVKVND